MNPTVSNAIDWPRVLETHKPWLAKVLRCRVGDEHAVDDLLQEIALAVVRQNAASKNGAVSSDLPQRGSVPNDPQKIAPWLYRLAVRQAVNFHRRTNRKCHAKPLVDVEPSSPAAEPLAGMLAAEQQQRFRQALNQISPAQREILTLKYTENWSYQQLADHLGIPVRSVEYRLLQARNELKRLL